MFKIRWPASIWRQNDQKCWVTSQNIQNNAKLQIWSNYNELHQSDVKTIKTKLNYKSDQNPMTCTSKRSKMLSYVAKHSKQRKTTNLIKLQWIASIGCQNDQNKAKLQKWPKSNNLHFKTIKNVELRRKTLKTTQTTKPIKLQWIASIGCQNDQNKAKLQKWSKSNDLHRFDVKTIKTKLNYKSDLNNKSVQNPMTCIDLTSKRSKQS